MKFFLVHKQARERAIEAIRTAPDGWRCEIKEPGRSLDQNSLSHVWYEEIALALPEDDALGWKCYCKLHHGVPILRAEDEQFREFYDANLKRLSYEYKLEAMKFFSVTSLMTKKQLSKYMDAVQNDFEAKGVRLTCLQPS